MFRSIIVAGSALLFALPVPASARVVSSGPNGFEVETGHETGLTPERLYALFVQPQRWWDWQHTYSKNASRMRLDLRPGGCFCERLDGGGGVEHMRVVVVQPGKQIVMTGALGPLLYEGVTGVLDVQFKPASGNTGGRSLVMVNYRASGFVHGNGADLARQADAMLSNQINRLFLTTQRMPQ